MEAWTDEAILGRMRGVAATQGQISARQWQRQGLTPSAAVVRGRFGSWKAAWDKLRASEDPSAAPGGEATAPDASAASPKRRGPKPVWTRDHILDVLRAVAQDSGGPIGQDVWQNLHNSPSTSTICTAFGGWARAWKAAGYNMPPDRSWDRPHQDGGASRARGALALAQALLAKGALSAEEWDRDAEGPSSAMFIYWYGSWDAAVQHVRKNLASEETPRAGDASAPAATPVPQVKAPTSPLRTPRRGTRRGAGRTRRASPPDIGRLLALPPYRLTERERLLAEELQAGTSLAQASASIGLDESRARRLIGLAGTRSTRRPPKLEIAGALAALWRELGGYPTEADWDGWVGRPCESAAVAAVFGSWVSALLETIRERPDLLSRPAKDRSAAVGDPHRA